ncbi:hypothetical protein L596_018096 [Steinernema carpocapsae]|uniref:BPL/LPL catalytic domain-containing protein n=1 Tax=Steinernema carpocapsae TaxID=34508 RepID=A0A4U5N3Y0_STECR|nr:hypothetical protein L596_018096 [Steinernema carpocapsae]
MDISRSIVAGLKSTTGVLIVAQMQTKGRGRGGNQWLSPSGCAMFTFNYALPLDSNLGQSSAFVQHILAVRWLMLALKTQDYDLPFEDQMPNDLTSTEIQEGGILVTASIERDTLHCVLGCALNVANSQPTVCLNDFIIPEIGAPLTIEATLADIMNKFEKYVEIFQNEGKESFLKAYHNSGFTARGLVS